MKPGEPAPPPRYPARAEPMAVRAERYGEQQFSPARQEVELTANGPALPRRRQRESLAPQLSVARQLPRSTQGRRERPPERARDLFSEIEAGTRQGRMARPAPDANHPDGREGAR